MTYAFLIILLLTSGSGFGQLVYSSIDDVKQFLQLSDSQMERLLQNNQEYTKFAFEKRSRIGDVRIEIASETAKEQLDPMALGVRYAEVETICRQIRAKGDELLKQNQEVLDTNQKAKLKILEDAFKLGTTIQQANQLNLLSYGSSIGSGIPLFSLFSFFGPISPTGLGCSVEGAREGSFGATSR